MLKIFISSSPTVLPRAHRLPSPARRRPIPHSTARHSQVGVAPFPACSAYPVNEGRLWSERAAPAALSHNRGGQTIAPGLSANRKLSETNTQGISSNGVTSPLRSLTFQPGVLSAMA